MERKYYCDYAIKDCASTIMLEVIHNGFSEGWCGGLEEKEAVEKVLNKFNVFYTHDMLGRWDFLIKT